MSDTTHTNQDGTTIFTLLRFNPCRADRGAPAAEVLIRDDDNEVLLWMSLKNIEDNIREFGEHPGLVEARDKYREHGRLGKMM